MKILKKIILFIIQLPLLPIKLVVSSIANNKASHFLNSITVQNIDSLNGQDFEMLVCILFSNMGFRADVTKATRDYGADVVAIKKNKKYIIQTKLYYDRSVGNACINQVYTALDYYKGDVAIAITNSYFSKPAKTVAKELNVALIDRDGLIKLIGCPRKSRYKLFLDIINDTQI